MLHKKNRKSQSVKSSGGIIVGIKDDINTYVYQIRSESNFSLWFKINKKITLFRTRCFMCRNLYTTGRFTLRTSIIYV